MKPRLRLLILLLIVLLTFAIRFVPNSLNSINLGITFLSPDPYYHLRRIVLTAQNFPHFPGFDYYLSYPTGANCIWPPLFDFLCAFFAFIIGLGRPSLGLIEFFAALYPIIYAILTVLITYLIGKEIFNKYVGIMAAAIMSFLPANFHVSLFGYTDHHVAEAFSLLLICYLTIRRRDDIKSYILLGLAIGMGLLFWQGSIVFAGMVFLYLFITRDFSKYSPVAFLIGIIMILPFSLGNNYIGGYFTHRGLSMLYVSLLGMAGLLLLLRRFLIHTKYQWLLIPVAVSLATIFVILLESQLFVALNFVYKNEWTKTISELRPLFLKSGYIETLGINITYGRFYYVWPIMLVLLAFDKDVKKRFFFIYVGVLMGFLNFVVVKYGAWFSPFYTLLLAYFIYLLFTILNRILPEKLRVITYVVLGTIVFVIFQPIFANWNFRFDTYPSKEAYAAYQWLKDSTQTPGFFNEPTKKPAYGVMSFWHNGHFLIYISQRPAVVTNFGGDAPNFDIANRFILSQTEAAANKILNDYNVRYVFCDGSDFYIYAAAKYLNLDPRAYFNLYYTQTADGLPLTAMRLADKGVRTIFFRLQYLYGCSFYSGSQYIEPVHHYRLVYASSSNALKIFEFVKGARILGHGKPGQIVKISVEVKLPNADFVYRDSLQVGANREFSATIPYPAIARPCKIDIGPRQVRLFISEAEVKNGQTKRISM